MLTKLSGKTGLDFDDFVEATKYLNLEVSTEKRLQIFVKCDLDASGSLEKEEFLQAVSQIEEDLASDVMGIMGLADSALWWGLIQLCLLLIFFLVFILCAIAAFSQGTSFEAVINSAFVGLSGLTSKSEEGNEMLSDEGALEESVDATMDLWGEGDDITN
jgi:hypothetical protein